MSWIPEMISVMRSLKSAEATNSRRPLPVEIVPKQISGVKDAWTELLLSLKDDVKDFNDDKARAGHSAVLISSEKLSIARFQFEIYLPEMNSKLLILTMKGNKVDVEVRPGFPQQVSAITVEAFKSSKGYRWMLGELKNDKEVTTKEVTTKQLSEYLLRPILSCASID